MHRDDPLIPDLLTPEEAGALLGMTKQGVTRMIQRGELPARRVGRQFVIRRAAVTAVTSEDEQEDKQ